MSIARSETYRIVPARSRSEVELRPGLLLGHVLVAEAGEPHRLLERALEARRLDEGAHRLEAPLELGKEVAVGVAQRPGLRNRAEVSCTRSGASG